VIVGRVRAAVRGDGLSCGGHAELGGDVAPLLREATETVGVTADLVDVNVAFFVQGPEQLAHRPERFGDEPGFLVLGLVAFGDMDIKPHTGETLFRQRITASEPVLWLDALDDDRRHLRIVA